MTVELDLAPPPQFDRSLVGYAVTNFNRIRNAFKTALGGNYQTGTFTANFVAQATIAGTVTYSPAFNASLSGPCVVITQLVPLAAALDIDSRVSRNDETGFVYVITSVGGPVTTNFQVRWVAFYP